MAHSAEIRVGRRACSQFTQGRPHGLVVYARPVKRPPELSPSPVARPFPCLAEAWRQVHGHAAAAGSEGIEHGRVPSGCTSGGRLPPLGRSNDRSPPTAMPLYPPHWAPPHARCRPCGAPFQYGCFSAPQSCARVFVSHLFALGARFRRRASSRFTRPAAVSGSRPPAVVALSGVARWPNTSV